MKEKILSVGSIISSFLASICCVGIALFSALGFSGLGLSFISVFSPYKKFFMVLAILMLGTAHYTMVKNSNASKSTRIILWTSTIITIVLIIYTFFLER